MDFAPAWANGTDLPPAGCADRSPGALIHPPRLVTLGSIGKRSLMSHDVAHDRGPVTEPAAPPSEAAQGAYRRDIDGLRAIAVLAVVIFHAGFGGLPGGFLGVDVFFVISGYLIGGQIFREAAVGDFRFSHFYARRVRRILPALYVLLAVMFVIGALILTPLELKELGKEAFAATFGASNILFNTAGGYFDPAADHLPLLMSWSLGVEEQFYIAFPILVLLCLKFRPRLFLPVLVVASLVSFAGSILLTHLDPKAAFYLLPTRAWELGLGAVLALWERKAPAKALSRGLGDGLAAGAVILLIAAMTLYRPAYAFPGWYALAPTVAATALIATSGSRINRAVLSWSPLVFIGKVSYSWYLWHWPLFFLDRILAPGGKGLPPILLLAISFGLALVSWRWVEQPFRRRKLTHRAVLLRYAGLAVLVALPALTFFVTDGWPTRFSPEVQALSAASRAARSDPCLAPYGAAAPRNLATCLPASGAPRLIVLGDSHASAIAPGFKAVAAQNRLGFGQVTKSSCPPLWGYAREVPGRSGHLSQCLAFQQQAFAIVRDDPKVEVVVLAGYWSSGLTLTSTAGTDVSLSDALTDTIARLEAMNKRVILVNDVPTFDFDPYVRIIGGMIPARQALSRALYAQAAPSFVAKRGDLLPDAAAPILSSVARAHPNVLFLDPVQRLCDQTGCRYGGPAALYYFDFQHLTATGAGVAVGSLPLKDRPDERVKHPASPEQPPVRRSVESHD
jgi:peptidoglycan/LPS O-acetylase OafA/YrhL